MFVARPGHVLVVADYSQMELRMLAHYSMDPVLLKAFEEGMDLHIITGARQSGMTYEQLLAAYESSDPDVQSDAKSKRSIGKTSNFALTYGMGGRKYQLRLAVDNSLWVTLEQAERWIKDYDDAYDGATKWKDKAITYARYLGYIKTIAGRRRRLPDLASPDKYVRLHAERQGVNAVIQGSCADVIEYVIPPIQTCLKALRGQVLLQVHDEIVCEVPEEMGVLAAKLVSMLMADLANTQFKLRCPMVADAHIGLNWGDAKG